MRTGCLNGSGSFSHLYFRGAVSNTYFIYDAREFVIYYYKWKISLASKQVQLTLDSKYILNLIFQIIKLF